MTKQEQAIANAIRKTKEEALESLSGEALITAAWVVSAMTHYAMLELARTNPDFDFVKFEQESSIEME